MFSFCVRWQKPTQERLLTQEYFAHYESEPRDSDDFVTVYRGLGTDDFPDLRGSTSRFSFKGSMLSKLSVASVLGKTSPVYQPDEKSLLADNVGSGESDDEVMELQDAMQMA